MLHLGTFLTLLGPVVSVQFLGRTHGEITRIRSDQLWISKRVASSIREFTHSCVITSNQIAVFSIQLEKCGIIFAKQDAPSLMVRAERLRGGQP